MQRDNDILEISTLLDNLYKEENSSLTYSTIMHLANNTFNLLVARDDNDRHTVYWYNRKIKTTNSFDDDLAILLMCIKDIIKIYRKDQDKDK